MALTLGQSHASTHKSLQYLNATRAEIEKSQLRLASGRKIVSPGDDVGGLAVAMKLEHQLTTTSSLVNNVNNAKSYAEMQLNAVENAYNIIEEMESLGGKWQGATAEQQTTYQTQFDELLAQLKSITNETVNGTPLFNNSVEVNTSALDSGSLITLDPINISALSDTWLDDLKSPSPDGTPGGPTGLSAFDSNATNFADMQSEVYKFQIQAASDISALGFASDYLTNMATSIESAHGRIMDVDVAEETINLSKLNLQQEAALAAIVQANLAMESVLKLLVSRND
jgi:flagellin